MVSLPDTLKARLRRSFPSATRRRVGSLVGSLVGDDGSILVVGGDPVALVTMTPRIEGAQLAGSCRFVPFDLALSSCR